METCQNCQNIGAPDCPLLRPADPNLSPYQNYLDQQTQISAHQIVLGTRENCFQKRYTIS